MTNDICFGIALSRLLCSVTCGIESPQGEAIVCSLCNRLEDFVKYYSVFDCQPTPAKEMLLVIIVRTILLEIASPKCLCASDVSKIILLRLVLSFVCELA